MFTRPFRLCGSKVNPGTTVRKGSLRLPRHESKEWSWRASPGLHRAANTCPAPRAGAPVRPRLPGRTGHPPPRGAVTVHVQPPGPPGKAGGWCPPHPLPRQPPTCHPHHLRPDHSSTRLLSASRHKPALFPHTRRPLSYLPSSQQRSWPAIPRNGHPLLSPPLSPHHLAPALLHSPLRPPPKPGSLRSHPHRPFQPSPSSPALGAPACPPPASHPQVHPEVETMEDLRRETFRRQILSLPPLFGPFRHKRSGDPAPCARSRERPPPTSLLPPGSQASS